MERSGREEVSLPSYFDCTQVQPLLVRAGGLRSWRGLSLIEERLLTSGAVSAIIGDRNMTDGEIDYYFNVAKALGAKGITRELSEDAAQRLGPIADQHKIMIGFHNHTQMTPTTYDGPILSHGKHLGINFDIGHYVAGTNRSPIPIIEKFHDRILSLHLKDRKINNGPNMPFGQGDTPVALVLQLLKRNQSTFPADIELEYPIPESSDAVAETTQCVQFCRQALA